MWLNRSHRNSIASLHQGLAAEDPGVTCVLALPKFRRKCFAIQARASIVGLPIGTARRNGKGQVGIA